MGILTVVRGIARFVRTVVSAHTRSAPKANLNKLNAVSLLFEAGYALHRGRKKRAALLFGAATLASRWKHLGWLVEGGLTLERIRNKLT